MKIITRHAVINTDMYSNIDFDYIDSEILLYGKDEFDENLLTTLYLDTPYTAKYFLMKVLDALFEGRSEFDATEYDIVFSDYDLDEIRARIKANKKINEAGDE